MAIDFIELAVNKDSLGGFGVNPEDRRFEEIRIGDIDGFGWGDGAALAAHDPAVASANDDLVNLPNKLPVNRDGFGLLASGDFLPDIDADGAVEDSPESGESADDWDRRSGEELAGTYYTGSGFTRSAESFFQLGSQYTDITLSKSYSASSGETDPVLTGDLERAYGAYPATDGNSHVGSNLPGQNNNHPFYFNFYVDPFAIDPAKPLYLTLTHGDLDTSLIEVEVRDIHANSATATLMAAGTTDDGAIESSFVVLDETTLEFDDIFTWDAARNKWHGYLEVRFNNIGASTDEYFAIDFLELSTSQKNIAVPGAGSTLRVPEDFDTIQAAINVALDGSTILVAPGLYRENLDMLGKNIVLRSHDPLDPAVVATTIIDGDVDDDGTGDGAVITFRGSEDETSAVRGFTIRNGNGYRGGGIAGHGTKAAVEYNMIIDNSALYGGGISMSRGIVRYNVIRENTAYVDVIVGAATSTDPTGVGGGIYDCKNLLQNQIHDNTAAIGGGGVWESKILGEATVTNNLIHHNEVTDTTLTDAPGAGIHIAEEATRTFLVHNTVVDNTWDGAVVNVIDESETAQFFNNILWDTSSPAPTSPDTDWDRLENSDLRFNIVGGAPAKGSDSMWNMGNNPAFTNAGTMNYTLQSTSPAIDAGIEFVPPIPLDIVRNLRAAATPDIGAYESTYSAPTQGYISISFPGVITEGETLQLTAHLSTSLQALVTGGATPAWQWRFNGDNISGATGATYVIDPVSVENAGNYAVAVTISGNTYVSGPSTLDIETPQLPEPDSETLPETDGLTMLPGHVFFDYVPLNSAAQVAVQVVNTSTTTQTGTAEITEGPFQLAYSPVPWSYNLDPGESVTIYLRAVPSDIGEFVGRLSFSTGEVLTMSCHTATQNEDGAILYVAPSLVQFGYVAPSGTKDINVTLTNTGTGHLSGLAITSTPFNIVGSSSYSIGPGESATLIIGFSPTTVNNYEGQVVFTGGVLGETIRVLGTSVLGSTAIASGVRINELAPWNTRGLQLAEGLHPDWIELYNENTEAVDLTGWTLTDDVTNSTLYSPFPTGTVIPAAGYLVIFAVANETTAMGQFCSEFELDEVNGGYVGLFDPASSAVSSVTYPAFDSENGSYSYLEVTDSKVRKQSTWGGGAQTPGTSNKPKIRCGLFILYSRDQQQDDFAATLFNNWKTFGGGQVFPLHRHTFALTFAGISDTDPWSFTKKNMLQKIKNPNSHSNGVKLPCPILEYFGHGWSENDGSGSYFVAVRNYGTSSAHDDPIRPADINKLWDGWGWNRGLGYKLVILNSCRSAGVQPYRDLPSRDEVDIAAPYQKTDTALTEWETEFTTDAVIGWRNGVLYSHTAKFSDDFWIEEINKIGMNRSFRDIFINAKRRTMEEAVPKGSKDAWPWDRVYWYLKDNPNPNDPEDPGWLINGPAYPELRGDSSKLDEVPCFLLD